MKIFFFNVWVRYFVWNFEGNLWNSTHNILPLHGKMCSLLINENLRTPSLQALNTLKPSQNGRHFADDIFKCIFWNENAWILLKISLKCVPMVRINNIPALVQMMDWRHPGDKPLSELIMVHACHTETTTVVGSSYIGNNRHMESH